ncbi:hypothetical protein ES332_A10G162500v1 [Gossypium tomentosum]|uniref:Uncharacterized protein n=1 Tax=Gossypium tomentosum TaxID=34277 RepID=A0A5D2NVV6_GOSTO|nr:hypothetical protein ES332_A10G162500v1 [Gossypium tomentosum]
MLSSPQKFAPDFFQPFSLNQASIHPPFIFISLKIPWKKVSSFAPLLVKDNGLRSPSQTNSC